AVDGIAEVSAPAVDHKAVQVSVDDLLRDGGDELVDIQDDEVVAEAVGEALTQHGGVILCGGRTGLDVVVSVHREGDADGAQLVHSLLLQVGKVGDAAQTDHGLTVVSAPAHLLAHQLGVLLAVVVVADAGHGVEVVLALQRVDHVIAAQPGGQIQAVGEALTESGVGDGLVPVVVGSAILVAALVVEVHLIAELVGALLAQLAVVFVAGVAGDGGQGGLAQSELVQLAVLIQLVGHGAVHQDQDGHALKAAVIRSAVPVGVGDIALGVAIDILLDQVGTAVVHLSIGSSTEAFDAQLVDEVLGSGVEADIACHGDKVGAGILAGEHQGVVVRSLDAHTVIQHILIGQVGGRVALLNGVVIVLLCAHEGGGGHGGVVGLVLVLVQDPLGAHQEVLGGDVAHDVAVDVAPIHVVAQVDGPDGSILVALPAGSDGGHGLAVAVVADQAVHQVGNDVEVGSALAVQDVPALQLTVAGFIPDIFGQRRAAVAGSGGGSSAGSGGAAGAGAGTAAGCQQTGSAHSASALQKRTAADFKVCVHVIISSLLFFVSRQELQILPVPIPAAVFRR